MSIDLRTLKNLLRVLPAALALANAGCANPAVTASGPGFYPSRLSAGHAGRALASAVPCSKIGALRSLSGDLSYVTNSATGDTVEYLVIGDGASSNDLLVMFPGTGQILPDWPVQMITNSRYSPKIVKTIGYTKSEDGPVSLCHNYRLILFDYPGVGKSALNGSVTRDMIASDVDALLSDVGTQFGLSTNVVDPVGWSLGTTDALKYAFLSPVSRPSRTIHNVILIATGPGGNTNGQSGMDSAECQVKMFSESLTATGKLERTLKTDLSQLIFPYVDQDPQDSGTNSGCTAKVVARTVKLSVTLQCATSNLCTPFIKNDLLNLYTDPWKLTKGIDSSLFAQQRQQANDWTVAFCSGAGANFTSTGCSSYGNVEQSVTNGGVCKTDASNTDRPSVTACVPLTLSGKMTVINGREDLFIQWTYGKALVDGYNALGSGKARLVTYPGLAGHGVMIQHPRWTQKQIQTAMATGIN